MFHCNKTLQLKTYFKLELFCITITTQRKSNRKQECIPVGCVPSAAVAVCWRMYLVPGGVNGLGVPCPRGCTWSGRVYLVRGCVPGPGGCTWSWGCTWSGGHLPRYPTPCGQTHMCKNITFATSLRTVIIFKS